jgi:glycosyltransferase involved in cell wall biosynthesis
VRPLAFLVPGSLDQLTGGYLYDRRVVEGLRRAGRAVAVHELAGRFPHADEAARAAFAAALARLPDDTAVAIDGLALPGGADALRREAARLRLVAFIHHPLALETGLAPEESRRLAVLEAALLRHVRGAICPSARTAEALVGYGMAESRIAVVPPGTGRPSIVAMPRQNAASEAERLHLLCVATVTPRKGHAVLVEALAGMTDLDWRLTCIGSLDRDPATVAELRRAIGRAGLAGRIELAGERPPERLGAAYAGADVFVLASFHEGYGMVFAEAMAHGLPIVGTTAGAIPETVPGEAGLLVPAGDAAALREALRRVVGDAALRHRLAAGARRAAAALPDWAETVRRWGEAFDRLAG